MLSARSIPCDETPPEPPATVEQLHDRFALLADVFRGNGTMDAL